MSSANELLGFLAFFLAFAGTCFAQGKEYINGTGIDGKSRMLDVSRYPSLYTGDFADCLGGESLFNVTKFDTAYYADNATVLFHLDGTSNIRNESLMLHLLVQIYGETRFNVTIDPCQAGIGSLCPLTTNVPVEAFAVLNVTSRDAASIPSIALDLPDLEGFARLRIFANSTKTEIGCLQAPMTNGNTLSQPKTVGTILGVFVFCAALASFAAAVYGVRITHMRMHYAHSFSVLVIFETLQSIFFSGALSVNWPRILSAWWSNFAWTAGMFASEAMVKSINPFAGVHGNASQVGGAGSVPINNGGGLTQQIYGRSMLERTILDVGPSLNTFVRRAEYNASDPYDYTWAGDPRDPGMPMPGDFAGFAGTLSVVNIPERAAFIIGFIWLLVILAAVALFVALVKVLVELLVKVKLIKTDGLDYFRSHWIGYMAAGLLRTLFIAFFAIMTLAMFQFSLRGPAGPTAIAAVVWIMLLFGLGGLAVYACLARIRPGKLEIVPDTLRFEQGKIFKTVPFVAITRESKIGEEEQEHKPKLYATTPFFRIKHIDNDPKRPAINEDANFAKRHGWLSARYRSERWWFFAIYLVYQFIRACFLGGAVQNPLAQVFGLFIFELIALVVIIKMTPFEATRNMVLAIRFLSISKILTTGLSIALLTDFNVDRIGATIIGIIIVVVQAFLAVSVLVLIVIGMFSTWMSLSRNREDFPSKVEDIRVRYYEHIEKRAGYISKSSANSNGPQLPPQGLFNVKDVRRAPKIHEEPFPTMEIADDNKPSDNAPGPAPIVNRSARASSTGSRYSVSSLPRRDRAHRGSWSAKDFATWDAEMNRGDQQRLGHVRAGSLRISSAVQQGSRPMTPTRESAEYPRPDGSSSTSVKEETSGEEQVDEAKDVAKERKMKKRVTIDESSIVAAESSTPASEPIPNDEPATKS